MVRRLATLTALLLGCTTQQEAPTEDARDETPPVVEQPDATAISSTSEAPAPEPLPPARRPLSFEQSVPPATGKAAYLLLDHHSVLRLDDAGWQTIWAQEHIHALALDGAGTLHVFDNTGVHALSSGAMRTLLAFEGGSPREDRRFAIEGMRRFALGRGGDLWFAHGAGEPGLMLVRRDGSLIEFSTPALDEVRSDGKDVLFGLAREGGIVHLGERRGWARTQPWTLTTGDASPLAAGISEGELFVLYEDGLVRLDHEGRVRERMAVAEGARHLALVGKTAVTLASDCTLQRFDLAQVVKQDPSESSQPPPLSMRAPAWQGSLGGAHCDDATLAVDASARVWASSDASSLVLVSPPGITEALPLTALPGRLRQIAIVGKGPSTGDGLTAPSEAQLLAPERAAATESPRASSSAPTQHSWQLGTKKALADAKLLRDELDAGLRERGIEVSTYVLARERKHLIMAGDFADPSAAESRFYEAKEILGQGGFVRSMAEFCPVAEELEPGVHRCKSGAVQTLEIGQLTLVAGEGEPPPLLPRPKAARYVVVITTDKPFSPGGDELRRNAAYRSHVWQPALGSLPAKASDAAPMLEIHDGAIVADPSGLARVELREQTVALPRCNCAGWHDENPDNDIRPGVTVDVTLHGLDAHPLAGGASIELLSPTWAGTGKGSITVMEHGCVDKPGELRRELQIVGVAGSTIMLVDRQTFMACDDRRDDNWSMVMVDLGSAPSELAVAELERELGEQAKRLRTRAAEDVGMSGIPKALNLSAVFPRFAAAAGPAALYQFTELVCFDCDDDDDWGTMTNSARVQARLPEGSMLMPPSDALALIAHVRAASDWTIIGWSRG